MTNEELEKKVIELEQRLADTEQMLKTVYEALDIQRKWNDAVRTTLETLVK